MLSNLFKKTAPTLPEAETVLLPSLGVEVAVIRSARKRSSSIEIRDKAVIIRVPKRMRISEIQSVLEEKSGWISKKLDEQARRPDAPKRIFAEGEQFPFLGDVFTLKIEEGPENKVFLEKGHIVMQLKNIKRITDLPARVKRTLRKWYMDEALKLLTQETHYVAEQIYANAGRVTVRDFKSRWGGCHPNGDIHYNWRIILGPMELVDYLVAHEVSHLHHHNHSPDFWAEVEAIMPDYKKWRNWLKDNSKLLSFD